MWSRGGGAGEKQTLALTKMADHPLFFSPPGTQGAEASSGKHPRSLDGGTGVGAFLRAAKTGQRLTPPLDTPPPPERDPEPEGGAWGIPK